MFAIATLQSSGFRLRNLALDQPIAKALNTQGFSLKISFWKLVALMMQMGGVSEQGLHGSCPKGQWVLIDNSLQVADLVRKADLALFSRGFQLSRQAVAGPYFSLAITHHGFDHIFTPVEADDMQNSCHGTKDPLPPGRAIHPAAGFITIDDCTLADFCLNALGGLLRFLTCSLHDLVKPWLMSTP